MENLVEKIIDEVFLCYPLLRDLSNSPLTLESKKSIISEIGS